MVEPENDVMNLASSLEIFLGYNLEVIAWLFVLIVLGVLFLIWRSQFKEEESKSVVEELLHEFIEFKKSLASSEELISQAQQEALTQEGEAENSEDQDLGEPVEGDSSDVKELQEQVDQLQAKLHEYEIIEEDIADLSTYKEENIRLKEELKKLQEVEETPPEEVQEAVPKEPEQPEDIQEPEVESQSDEPEDSEIKSEESSESELEVSEIASEDDKTLEELADDVMAEFFVNKEVESDPTKITQGGVTPPPSEEEDEEETRESA